MKRLLLGCALLCSFLPSAWAFDHQHGHWAETLKSYRNEQGNVAYAKLKEDGEKDPNQPFHLYLNEIQAVPESEYKSWDQNQRKAFLINAYNALTLKLIVDHYPVSSIKKIGGFLAKPWGVKFFKLLNGQIEKLDALDHGYLRKEFPDARLLAALNSAARSYPQLRAEPYVPERLEAQLDEQMRAWLNDPARNLYHEENGQLKISRIFDWYEQDIDSWGGDLRDLIRRYGPPAAVKALQKKGKISYQNFDWTLNEAP